ncbi:hypothetical protein AMAG_02769 [Allomyces macrogynus ATCC 38327]|uniref:Uncharacterized protein n=1 Tax=Allomyces macrogynus (strain ATCC 38327) TaxID=578462 RepID=A0A0L0S3R0_ALLM3|nr:hypothetical protein AMAG_02769 [Allomyces macrogynus ATCC 38327]|eukprot:KNE57009.1 hypothetical protein AMAG_02769 [Allomyces macrogynus ATCC 38327]
MGVFSKKKDKDKDDAPKQDKKDDSKKDKKDKKDKDSKKAAAAAAPTAPVTSTAPTPVHISASAPVSPISATTTAVGTPTSPAGAAPTKAPASLHDDGLVMHSAPVTPVTAHVEHAEVKASKHDLKTTPAASNEAVAVNLPSGADETGPGGPPEKPRVKCCLVVDMPMSIVLMIVVLLCNDIWFAWYSMKQANQTSGFTQLLHTAWNNDGMLAAAAKLRHVTMLFNANVGVAVVDMIVTLLGLAGVDGESFPLFATFTAWKTLQFVYSVATSVVTVVLVGSANKSLPATIGASVRQTVMWEVGVSTAGLVLELYFLVFMGLYVQYLHRLQQYRVAAVGGKA